MLARDVRRAPFAGDETGWISAAFYHTGLVLAGDFSHASWVAPDAASYGNMNPQLGKLLMGLPLQVHARYFNEGRVYQGSYVFREQTYEQNVAAGQVPPRNILLVGRAASAFFGGLWMLLAAWLCYRCGGRFAAVATVCLLLAQPLFVMFSSRAMTDQHYNFFLLAAVCAMLPYAAANTRRAAWGWAAVVGVLTGCAASVKVTGVVAIGPLFLLVWLARLRHTPLPLRPSIVAMVLCCASAIVVIYAANPFYWPNLAELDVKALGAEWQTREARAEAVRTAQGGKPIWTALTSDAYERAPWEAQFPQWSNVLRPLEYPLLFLRWRHLFAWFEEILPWSEWRPLAILRMVFQELSLGFPWQLPFFFAGCYVAARRARDAWRAGRIDACALLLAYFAFQFALLFLLMPVPMRRYFLPCTLGMHLLSALGLVALIQAGLARWGKAPAACCDSAFRG
jgi:4-amino-4-deoxy-L-arabinose transferase-like glycosyltransferase